MNARDYHPHLNLVDLYLSPEKRVEEQPSFNVLQLDATTIISNKQYKVFMMGT
jgi:hypothetical protein